MIGSEETGSIYVEGTDLVGKDVVGEIISGEFGITNIQKLSLHKANPWDADRTKELESGHPLFPAFLIRSIIWDIQKYDPEQEKDHLQISFTASRSAAWTQTSGDNLAGVYTELLKFSPLFKNTFLLSASVEVKRERLLRRAANGGDATKIDNLVFTKPKFVEEMDMHLRELVTKEMGGVVVDTSDMTTSQVGEIVVASIKGERVDIKRNDRRVAQLDISPELTRFHKELLKYSRSTINKLGLSEKFYDQLSSPLNKLDR